MNYIELNQLQRGSKGSQVKALQKLLNSGLDIDGVFGELTEESVKNFQSKNQLCVDGIVGFNTWNTLLTKG